MTAPTTDTTQVRWRGKGWRRRKDSLQTSWRADHTPWNNPLMKDITCNSQEPVWNAASQGEGTTVRGAGDLKVDQSEWLCELYACVSKSTCILFSSTTGPCCLSLTIVAWTTFLKAASCSNNLKKCFSACHIMELVSQYRAVPPCPGRWECPWVCRIPPRGHGPSDRAGPPGQTSVCTGRKALRCDAAAPACSSGPWSGSPAGGCTPWEPETQHTLIWLDLAFFFFFKYIFICTTLMPSTGSWNLIFFTSVSTLSECSTWAGSFPALVGLLVDQARVWADPQATLLIFLPCSAATSRGLWMAFVVPSPSWPSSLSPHVYTSPEPNKQQNLLWS